MGTRLAFKTEGGEALRVHFTDADGIEREMLIGMVLLGLTDEGAAKGKERFKLNLAWQSTVEPPVSQ